MPNSSTHRWRIIVTENGREWCAAAFRRRRGVQSFHGRKKMIWLAQAHHCIEHRNFPQVGVAHICRAPSLGRHRNPDKQCPGYRPPLHDRRARRVVEPGPAIRPPDDRAHRHASRHQHRTSDRPAPSWHRVTRTNSPPVQKLGRDRWRHHPPGGVDPTEVTEVMSRRHCSIAAHRGACAGSTPGCPPPSGPTTSSTHPRPAALPIYWEICPAQKGDPESRIRSVHATPTPRHR